MRFNYDRETSLMGDKFEYEGEEVEISILTNPATGKQNGLIDIEHFISHCDLGLEFKLLPFLKEHFSIIKVKESYSVELIPDVLESPNILKVYRTDGLVKYLIPINSMTYWQVIIGSYKRLKDIGVPLQAFELWQQLKSVLANAYIVDLKCSDDDNPTFNLNQAFWFSHSEMQHNTNTLNSVN